MKANALRAINPGRRPDRVAKKKVTRNDQRELRRFGIFLAQSKGIEPSYPVIPADLATRALRRRGVKPVRITAPVPYLLACLVARLSSRAVIYVNSAGEARVA